MNLNALFNGHHNVDLMDTGFPFVPNNSCLDELLEGLGVLSESNSASLHRDASEEELEEVIKIVTTINPQGWMVCRMSFIKQFGR